MSLLSSALVINDMQAAFKVSNDLHLLAAVRYEIEQTKQGGGAIVIVEYDPVWLGKSHDCLLELLAGYSRVIYVVKDLQDTARRMLLGDKTKQFNEDDGSEQILHAFARSDFRCDRFRFCGVHTEVCILKTVRGLRRLLPHCELSVLQHACRTRFGGLPDGRIVQEFKQLGCSLV